MTYLRVVPRDLFNEADLLKCYGRLWILLDFPGHKARLDEGNGTPFAIEQDPNSGALTVANLAFTIAGKPYRLTRPLNSREPWPLYAESEDEEVLVSVFDKHGDLDEDFERLIYGEETAT